MKNGFKKAGLIITIVLLTGLAFVSWASYIRRTAIRPEAKEVTDKAIVIDPEKLKLLAQVFQNLDPSREEYLITGSIDASNGADSLDHINNAEYILSRKGGLFYYKLGQTETINTGEVCIYIDHGIKKIMISATKEVAGGLPLPNLREMTKGIAEEGFTLSSTKISDTRQEIILKNPYNLTCKMYSITFNSETLKPEKIYTRLSNFEEPENDLLDKVISIKILKAEAASGISKFIAQQAVKKKGDTWVQAKEYEDYELINTL